MIKIQKEQLKKIIEEEINKYIKVKKYDPNEKKKENVPFPPDEWEKESEFKSKKQPPPISKDK